MKLLTQLPWVLFVWNAGARNVCTNAYGNINCIWRFWNLIQRSDTRVAQGLLVSRQAWGYTLCPWVLLVTLHAFASVTLYAINIFENLRTDPLEILYGIIWRTTISRKNESPFPLMQNRPNRKRASKIVVARRTSVPNCCLAAIRRYTNTRVQQFFYSCMSRSDVKFWPVYLCCAVVRRKSASLRLVSMRSNTILP
jgi:hypothetical protein